MSVMKLVFESGSPSAPVIVPPTSFLPCAASWVLVVSWPRVAKDLVYELHARVRFSLASS